MSFVRQLEPDWHIDTDFEIVSQLAVSCTFIPQHALVYTRIAFPNKHILVSLVCLQQTSSFNPSINLYIYKVTEVHIITL